MFSINKAVKSNLQFVYKIAEKGNFSILNIGGTEIQRTESFNRSKLISMERNANYLCKTIGIVNKLKSVIQKTPLSHNVTLKI